MIPSIGPPPTRGAAALPRIVSMVGVILPGGNIPDIVDALDMSRDMLNSRQSPVHALAT